MTLRERIRCGELLLGTVVTVPDPSLAELASSPFDLAWIDLEHGALDIRDLPGLTLGIKAASAAAVVRLPSLDSERLPAVLDAGVDGVVAPRVNNADEARCFVGRLRYPPEGRRGFGPRRAGGYGRTPRFWKSDASSPAILVQVESANGVAASAEIAAIDGIDALVVGTADLSFDLGSPQATDTTTFREAAETVRRAAAESGKAFGVAAGSASTISSLLGATGTVGILSVDVRIYAAAIDAAADELRNLLPTKERELQP